MSRLTCGHIQHMYSWWWVRLSPETCKVKPLRRIKTQLLHLVGLFTTISMMLGTTNIKKKAPKLHIVMRFFKFKPVVSNVLYVCACSMFHTDLDCDQAYVFFVINTKRGSTKQNCLTAKIIIKVGWFSVKFVVCVSASKFMFIRISFRHIQGVTGGTDKTSGGCSLC